MEEIDLTFRLDANGRTAPSNETEKASNDNHGDDCTSLDYTSKTVMTQFVEPKESFWNELLLDCEVSIA
jgi:hypothetical protein